VGHKSVHSFCWRRWRPLGGQAGASKQTGACLGYVEAINTYFFAVALSVRILRAIQQIIQNKLRAGTDAAATWAWRVASL
jgi:hypothetical protein